MNLKWRAAIGVCYVVTLFPDMATARFEIEDQDLALAALDDFRSSTADFSDCLVGRRNRAAGAGETVTFDKGPRSRAGCRLPPPFRRSGLNPRAAGWPGAPPPRGRRTSATPRSGACR